MATETTFIQFQEGSAPSTPASTKWRAYFKSDGLYVVDDAGTETGPLAVAGGGASLGDWESYTPTWAASGGTTTLGNGTLVGRYKALDATTYIVQIHLTWGSTTSATGSTWSFSLPSGVTSASGRSQTMSGWIVDSGTDNKMATGLVSASATTIGQIVPEGSNIVTATAPMTWTTSDQLALNGTLEVSVA